MKMRDKKMKKVNRRLKAGLALVCVGALLGGTVLTGGDARVLADENENTIDIIGIQNSKDDTGSYTDLYYYLKDSNGEIIKQQENPDIELGDLNAKKQIINAAINYHVIIDAKRSNYYSEDYETPKIVEHENGNVDSAYYSEGSTENSVVDVVKGGIAELYDNAKEQKTNMTLAFSSTRNRDSGESGDGYTYELLEDGGENERYDDAIGKLDFDSLGDNGIDGEYLQNQIKKYSSSSACDVYVLITDGSENITDDSISSIKQMLRDSISCLYWIDITQTGVNNPYEKIAKKIDLNDWAQNVKDNNDIQCMRISGLGTDNATLTDANDNGEKNIQITSDGAVFSGKFYAVDSEPESEESNSNVAIEGVIAAQKDSYVYFSSRDASDGYAQERSSTLYNNKIKLANQEDVNISEQPVTYNIVWDIGSKKYESDGLFDEVIAKIHDFENPVESVKNKVNVIDCDGKTIKLDNEQQTDENKKLTGDKLEKILNDSKNQTDAYVIVTDKEGIESSKDVLEKSRGNLIYLLNIDDEEGKVSIENDSVKEITGNSETGVDKWDNAKNMIGSSVCFKFEGVKLTTVSDGDSTNPVSIEVDSIQVTNINVYVENSGKIIGFWAKLKLWQKILIIACAALLILFIVMMIIVSVRRKKSKKRNSVNRGIPHGAPSSSPDVQLRSGVSPTAETNVLARRAGEQNMQAMQGQIPANNTMQVQLQIIGRNPKIINTYINGSIFVGRANTCDVFINDATISRQHFALECVNGEMFIQPLVATNGTKLNGQRINDKHQLYPNDRIQVGTVGIIVRW